MATFRRSALQLSSVRLLSETTTFVCRSCRSRIASTQTRQLHASSISKAERQRSEYFSETDSGKGQRSLFEPGLGQEDGVDGLSVGSRKQRKRQKGDPGYTPAKTADGLERIGTKQWVESMRDPKDRFQGWSRDKPAEINISNVELFLQKIMADAFGGAQPSFDAANKFRLAESVAKFTGIRIPDLKMEQIRDVSSLRAALVRKQKEARFSEVFGKNQNAEVRDLPNVSISDRRVTMFDKENERGRWKIIEKALRQRGLPVFKKEANRNKRLL